MNFPILQSPFPFPVFSRNLFPINLSLPLWMLAIDTPCLLHSSAILFDVNDSITIATFSSAVNFSVIPPHHILFDNYLNNKWYLPEYI